jgi:hypothetical protein
MSRLVMPTNKGRGASIMSIRAWGRIGTRARHHLKGYRSAFKPRTAGRKLGLFSDEDDWTLSRKTAERSVTRVSKEKRVSESWTKPETVNKCTFLSYQASLSEGIQFPSPKSKYNLLCRGKFVFSIKLYLSTVSVQCLKNLIIDNL